MLDFITKDLLIDDSFFGLFLNSTDTNIFSSFTNTILLFKDDFSTIWLTLIYIYL